MTETDRITEDLDARSNGAMADEPAVGDEYSKTPLKKAVRKSVFKETGLEEDALAQLKVSSGAINRPRLKVRFRSQVEVYDDTRNGSSLSALTDRILHPTALFRLSVFAFFLAFLIFPLQSARSLSLSTPPLGADAVPVSPRPASVTKERQLLGRQITQTDVCKRWSQQSALVNGTLYLYGGRAITDSNQVSNEWNDDFLTLDLNSDWQIASPSLTGLPKPSGPPAVANGFLWNSYTHLFLYGGEYSDTPATSPLPLALWTYDIPTSSWSSYPSPTTTPGQNSDGGNQPVGSSAEGAGLNVPEIGRGYYFGGHQDGYTTPGWSQSIWRIYLRSMIEFTFPGFSNPALNGASEAGPQGLWRNITSGGLQDSAGFTERADGVLVYVPGFGDNGIILGLAGGTNVTYTQMNVIDVFDIATTTWYKQSTSGQTPQYRVNPCAVAVSAADGSSINVYMYGGQSVIPYGDQVQYNDVWILSVPAFEWISVDTSGQANPPARAGHTCNVWNAQMIVVGGYVGNLSCDAPGIYVFDTSKLQWTNEYNAATQESNNPFNQQDAQMGKPAGLAGSYGYTVPNAVQSVIGGGAEGSATVTAPSISASDGPFATGKPNTYSLSSGTGLTTQTSTRTSTDASGAKVTSTSVSTVPVGSDDDGKSKHGAPAINTGAVAAGVVAGICFLVALYLGFCAYVYRRQLVIYKNHVTIAQRANLGLDAQNSVNLLFPPDASSGDRNHTSDENVSPGQRPRRGPGQYQAVPTNSKEGGYGRTGSSRTRKTEGGRTTGESDSRSISSLEDLLGGNEPSFLGVVLNPRRHLRVINT